MSVKTRRWVPARALLDVSGRAVRVTGRTAEAVQLMRNRGSVTAADLPAGVRLAAYIYRLRDAHRVPIIGSKKPTARGDGEFTAYSLGEGVSLVSFEPGRWADA